MNPMQFKHATFGKKLFILLMHLLMLTYTLLILYPLFNMVMSSFKTTRAIMMEPFALPESIDFHNYHVLWVEQGFARYFLNSLLITAASMALVLLLGSMAAFGISRYHFKGNHLVYMFFLSGIMLPLKAAIIPLFQLIKDLGLMDNPFSVILIFLAMGLPSTIFILAGTMKQIPDALVEAALIDGANDLRIYKEIAIPLSMPSIALAAIYNSVPIWNDFFFPLVFLQRDRYKTLPVGLSSFVGQFATKWDLLFTGLSIAIVPVLILYLFMSNYFIKGMTAGAVKS